MRAPESTIKKAILHPEAEIRKTAVRFFSDAYSQDGSIMPLVIQAVQTYGREQAFRTLREAERLVQTEPTVDWLIEELRRDYELADPKQDNYRFAVALVLANAPPRLLRKRLPEILRAPAFPEPLVGPLQERLEISDWSWERGWAALMYLVQDTLRRDKITANDDRYARRIVESLARYKRKANMILALLDGNYPPQESPELMYALHPFIVDLAGAMRLDGAVPRLVQLLDDDPKRWGHTTEALGRIGSEDIVRMIDRRWWTADEVFRDAAAYVLDHLRSDLCEARCLAFLRAEDDPTIQMPLADALLANFSEDGIDWARRLVANIEDEGLTDDEWVLWYRLVAVATIMGKTFPALDQWRQQVLRDNWGRGEWRHDRLADEFRPDEVGPKMSMN